MENFEAKFNFNIVEKDIIPHINFNDPPLPGSPVLYDVAMQCAQAYASIMADHGLSLDDDTPINRLVPYSKKVTYSEDFFGLEAIKWLEEAHKYLRERYPGEDIYTKLVLGYYTSPIIDNPASKLDPALKEKKRRRITVFIVPYTKLSALGKLGMLGTTEYVYDFGSLQP